MTKAEVIAKAKEVHGIPGVAQRMDLHLETVHERWVFSPNLDSFNPLAGDRYVIKVITGAAGGHIFYSYLWC